MADSPIAYSPASAPRAHGRYVMTTGGAFFDYTPKVVQFKAADYEVNIGQYLNFNGAAYTWTVLKDCTIAIDANITIQLTAEVDNRCTATTYLRVNGVRVTESDCNTYHRTRSAGVLNDRMTANLNFNVQLSAGDVIDFEQVQIAGSNSMVSMIDSSVSMEVLDGLISSAGFLPQGTGVTQGEMLRWNGVNWEVTDQLTVRDNGRVRGIIETSEMPEADAYTKINTTILLVDELPATPGYNTLYLVVDPT